MNTLYHIIIIFKQKNKLKNRYNNLYLEKYIKGIVRENLTSNHPLTFLCNSSPTDQGILAHHR